MLQTDQTLESWLEAFLTQEGASAGTVHLLEGDALALRAAVNIPPPVVAATANGAVCGVVGSAFRGEREFAESELLRYEAQVNAVVGR
jgi:hypothetical protein